MKIGIIGLKGSGKTTIFNALTGNPGHTDSSGGKKGYSLGLTNIPDSRIDALSAIFKPKKTVYAHINFIDFPGSTKDERGFSDESLRRLNDVDALAVIVKGFIPDMYASPVKELDTILADMILSDLILTERTLKKLEKDKQNLRLFDLFKKINDHLSNDLCLSLLALDEYEEHLIAGYTFVTRKPALVVLNYGENTNIEPLDAKIKEICERQNWQYMQICGCLEEEIAQLPLKDQADFLTDLGVKMSASNRFIRASYALLDLISFFTTGENEVRAWSIKNGTRALKAAGKIHTDMERGFIRAEVIGFEDFIQCGDFQTARKKGLLRLEGKEYEVKDGDIITFRFNV